MNSTASKSRLHREDSGLSQSYLASIEASSHDPIIRLTRECTIVGWNPAAEKLYGWTNHEILGRSISRIILPEDFNAVHRILEQALSGEEARQFESACTGKDGRRIDVLLNVSPIRKEGGIVTGVVTIVRDITRRLRGRETLLRRNRELLTFHRLSQIVLSSRSLQESYRDIANEIRAATSFPIVAIAIADKPRQMIVFHGLKGRQGSSGQPQMEMPINKALSGVVIRSGKPLFLTHASDQRKYQSSFLRRTRAQTFVGYPMKVGREIIGCLNLAHTEKIEISKEMRQWIEGLANYVAVLTERKRAEEELSTSREQLRELSRRTQSAIEDERKRIAREIHDELGQELSLLQLDLGLIQELLPRTEKDLLKKAKSMTKLTDSAIRSVQRISSDLRPTLLDNLGLGAATEWAVEQFQKRTGIRCRTLIVPSDVTLDPDRSTALFRIMQEALTNILRHAKATKVRVHLVKRVSDVQLRVRDNGVGIGSLQISDPKSAGLAGIRERVLPFQGNVTFSGMPGKGTEVIVTVPIES